MPSELTFKDINLGSVELDQIVDSAGQPLIEAINGGPEATSNFTFGLGSFANNFTPESSNLADWYSNWRPFDFALFAADPDIIGIQGGMTVDGKSVSEHPNADTNFNFSGLDAYLWIYNDTVMVPGSEWFLGRADTWVFPDTGLFDTNCESCSGETPLNWSTSDFASNTIVNDTPLYGSQSGENGEGSYTVADDNFTLQTFGIVPEPATFFLPAMIGVCLLFRRMRKKGRS